MLKNNNTAITSNAFASLVTQKVINCSCAVYFCQLSSSLPFSLRFFFCYTEGGDLCININTSTWVGKRTELIYSKPGVYRLAHLCDISDCIVWPNNGVVDRLYVALEVSCATWVECICCLVLVKSSFVSLRANYSVFKGVLCRSAK